MAAEGPRWLQYLPRSWPLLEKTHDVVCAGRGDAGHVDGRALAVPHALLEAVRILETPARCGVMSLRQVGSKEMMQPCLIYP